MHVYIATHVVWCSQTSVCSDIYIIMGRLCAKLIAICSYVRVSLFPWIFPTTLGLEN